MKKCLKLLRFSTLIVLISLLSCSEKEISFNEDVLYDSLKKTMAKDVDVALRDIAIKKSMQNIKEDKYGDRTGKIDYKYVEQNIKDAKTLSDRIKVYEKAGYKNAKEMNDNEVSMLYHITNVKRKYPDLAKLSPKKRSKLFDELSRIRISQNNLN